jgi:AcrR family transcriptional regulator
VSDAPRDPRETRDRILDAAERLFAERGYDAAPIREITAEAGVNVASVNYHFGGKEALYNEMFRRLLGELKSFRTDWIRSALHTAGSAATLETFLEAFAQAFVEPFLGGGRGRAFMALFDDEMRHRRLPREVFWEELVEPMLALAEESLQAVGLELDRTTLAMCLMSVVGQLMHVLMAQQRLCVEPPVAGFPTDVRDYLSHIVTFSAAGIRAVSATAAPGTGVGQELSA